MVAALRSCQLLFQYALKKGSDLKSFYSIFSKKTGECGKLIDLEKKHAAAIYEPIPIALTAGKGVKVWDVDGKEYLDFIGGEAALNTGHSHPKILQELREQAGILHHTSRAIHNMEFPKFAEYITQYFGYDKVIPMNSGVEAGETAIKVARRWGYQYKTIPENEAIVVLVTGNFWGRSLAAISSSTDPILYEHFGPYLPGLGLIPFDDLTALEEVLENPKVCAFMVEPILTESGVIVPCERYLTQVRKLCSEKKVLWIGDEIQTGLGRTGALLGCDNECVRPDLLVLGRSLAGGFMPMSAVLGNDDVMSYMAPGTHGSTFGGNPLASKLAIKTLEVIIEECLVDNARKMGDKFRQELTCKLPKDVIPCIRGKGLMNVVVINPDYGTADELCKKMRCLGLLAKHCDDRTIRFTPPLVIDEEELCKSISIITEAVHSMQRKQQP